MIYSDWPWLSRVSGKGTLQHVSLKSFMAGDAKDWFWNCILLLTYSPSINSLFHTHTYSSAHPNLRATQFQPDLIHLEILWQACVSLCTLLPDTNPDPSYPATLSMQQQLGVASTCLKHPHTFAFLPSPLHVTEGGQGRINSSTDDAATTAKEQYIHSISESV